MADSFTPTKSMQDEARRGLDWRQEHGRGGTEVGVARARDIVNGRDLSLDTVKRMSSYFARHEVDKDAEGWSPGEEGYPSAGRIAWALWGGDPGRAWALAIITETEGRDVDLQENERMDINTTSTNATVDAEITFSTDSPQVRYGRLDVEHRKVAGRDVEFRTVTAGRFEVRAVDGADRPMHFRGYAAVFDSPSEPLPFVETIRPGAFRRSLNSGREVRVFVNHNTDLVLGSTRSGTFTVGEDEHGLYVDGELPDTTTGRDLSVLMQRGDVDTMSFGFSIPRGGDSWSDDGQSRELREIILHEVSVVTGFPAYQATDAAVRNADSDPQDDTDDDDPIGVPITVLRRLNDLYAKKA